MNLNFDLVTAATALYKYEASVVQIHVKSPMNRDRHKSDVYVIWHVNDTVTKLSSYLKKFSDLLPFWILVFRNTRRCNRNLNLKGKVNIVCEI